MQKTANRIKGKYKYNTNQLFNFAKDSYLERTSRPIYAIIFLLPFIIFYEVGTFLTNTDLLRHYWQGRVVAFSLLQEFLSSLGFSSKFAWVAPPLAVVVILIALQITSGKQWRFWLRDFLPMVVECILLAVPLIVLTLFLGRWAVPEGNFSRFDKSGTQTQIELLPSCSSVTGGSPSSPSAESGGVEQSQSLLANIVTGIGAGIYEELIFRLILICLLMLLFQDVLRLTHKKSIVLSILISAALFSAHHHIIFIDGQFVQSAPFNWTEFVFRTIAGIYFAVLFAIRGFGITAGTHAFYDIIATIINMFFFQK